MKKLMNILLVVLIVVIMCLTLKMAWGFTVSGSCIEHKCCICEKALYEWVNTKGVDMPGYYLQPDGISWPYRYGLGLCEGDRASFLTYEFRESMCDECLEKYGKEFQEVVDNTAQFWLELFRRGETTNIRRNRQINAAREARKKTRKLLELENEIKKLKGLPYKEIYGWVDNKPIYENPWISGVTSRTGISAWQLDDEENWQPLYEEAER